MFTRLRLVLAAALIGLVSSSTTRAMDVPPRVNELASGEITAFAATPVIVEAIKAQNASGLTLDQIKEVDKKWMATPGVADYMKALIESPAGKQIADWAKTHPYVSEVIVMDNQGANVALSSKTSDYWQGDEKKFSESFKDGGKIYVSPVSFDDSTQTYSVQVSVPVKDGDKLIGVICVGIDIEHI